MGHAPENTLASFRKGFELGAPLLELDVHLSAELLEMAGGETDYTSPGRRRTKRGRTRSARLALSTRWVGQLTTSRATRSKCHDV